MKWIKSALVFLLILVCVYFVFPDHYLKSIAYKARHVISYLDLNQFKDSDKFITSYNCFENYETLDKENDKKHIYNFLIAGHTYGDSSRINNNGFYPKFYDNLREINNIQSIDFIVLTGDVVQNSTIKSWDIIKNQLSTLGLRAYIAPGNHDVGSGEDNVKRDVFKIKFGETYFYYYHKKDLYIVLDPNIDNGNISGDQLKFLINIVKTKEKVNNIFVFSHQVIWYSDFFDGIIPNNNYTHTTNYWSTIAPLLEKQKENVYVIAGDVGDQMNGSELFCGSKKNIKYIASGMGAGRRDNYLAVQVVDGIVSIMPVFLP